MTEVGGESAVYFDPADPADAARAIAAAWSNRETMRTRGFVQVKLWQPDAMLAAYETLYRELARTLR
jgi:glycosyltransferase involved in cell wall biosynthesis